MEQDDNITTTEDRMEEHTTQFAMLLGKLTTDINTSAT